MDFVYTDGFAITTPWYKIFRVLGITVLFAFVVAYLTPQWKSASYWIIAGGLFLSTCQMLVRMLNNGRAFATVSYNGVNIPMYAGFAIGFRELSRLLLKCSLIQLPFLLLFSVGCTALVFFLCKEPMLLGFTLGCKAALLMCAGRLILLPFSFSNCTNDVAKVRFRSLALIGIVIICCITFLVFACCSLFVPEQGWAMLQFIVAVLVAYAFYRFYGWFYNTNRFDLMRVPQQ